jgi:hypothetical protein
LPDDAENIFAGLGDRVKEIAKKAENQAALQREVDIAVLTLQSKFGPLGQSLEALDKLSEQLTKAKEQTADVLSEFSVSKNVDRVGASIQQLAADTLFTLSTDPEVVANPSEQTVLAAWKRTTPVRAQPPWSRSRSPHRAREQKLLHDAQLELRANVTALLTDAVMAPVSSKFLASDELKVCLPTSRPPAVRLTDVNRASPSPSTASSPRPSRSSSAFRASSRVRGGPAALSRR